jgi:hypothetical protein
MLIQASTGFGMLYRLDLTKAAQALPSGLVERQEVGGEVERLPGRAGARVGLSRNSANTAMALLESRNLVLRPQDRPVKFSVQVSMTPLSWSSWTLMVPAARWGSGKPCLRAS